MSKFILFGKEVEFSKAADRYYKMLKVFEVAVNGASETFINFYNNSSGISDVLDSYADALYNISKTVAIEPLFKTLINLEIYDVSREAFEDACWDLSGAAQYYDFIAEKYNEIVGEENDARNYRAIRKASRGRWVGGGASVGSAIKGAITAGAMNAVTGLGHSVVNSIGNLNSSTKSITARVELYHNESTCDILDMGIRESIKDIFLLFMEFVNEYKENEGNEIWYDGSVFDSEKADTLLKNSSVVEGKEKELLFKAFSVCPYHYNLLATIFLKYEEERENIFEIAKKYKLDLSPLFELILNTMYDEEAQASEEKANETKRKMKDFMNSFEVNESPSYDKLELDCLDRYCSKCVSLLPGETEQFINDFEKYDALDKNKAIAIKKHYIWELSKTYNVDFSKTEKESIISNFIDNHPTLNYDVIVQKVHLIMAGLDVKQSKSLDKFEYSTLVSVGKNYEILSVNQAADIVNAIDNCKVSDRIKSKYIHDYEIWELFPKYNVGFTEDERLSVLYRLYQKIQSENNISDNEIKGKLYLVIKAIVSTETVATVFDKVKKSDTYIKNNITNAAKDQFARINLYGVHRFEFEKVNDWGNMKTYEREDIILVAGDEGFNKLYNDVKKHFKSDNAVPDYEDVFLIISTEVKSKSHLYTFFSYKKAYCMGYGGEICDVDFSNFKSVNDIGNLNQLDGKGIIGFLKSTGRSRESMESIAAAVNNIVAHIMKLMTEKESKLIQLEKYYSYLRSFMLGEATEANYSEEVPLPKKDTFDSFFLEQIVERMSNHKLIMANDSELDDLEKTLISANIGEENRRLLSERLNAIRLVKWKHRKDIEKLYLESGSQIPQTIYNVLRPIDVANGAPTGFIYDEKRIAKIKQEITRIKFYAGEKIFLIWAEPKYFDLDGEMALTSFKFILTNLRLIMPATSVSVRTLEELKLSFMCDIVVRVGENTYKFDATMFKETKRTVAALNNCIVEVKNNEITSSSKNQALAEEYRKTYQECFNKYPLPNEAPHEADSNNANASAETTSSNAESRRTDSKETETQEAQPVELTKQELINLVNNTLRKHNLENRYYAISTAGFDKKIDKAMKVYAHLSNDEVAVLLQDYTIFGTAKEGFVLTNKNIYINSTNHKKIIVAIKDIQVVGVYIENSNSFYVTLGTSTMTYRLWANYDKQETEKSQKFLLELLGYLQQIVLK